MLQEYRSQSNSFAAYGTLQCSLRIVRISISCHIIFYRPIELTVLFTSRIMFYKLSQHVQHLFCPSVFVDLSSRKYVLAYHFESKDILDMCLRSPIDYFTYQMASDALNRCFHRDWGALSRFMETESFDDQPLFFIIEEQIFRNLTMEHHAGTVDKIRFLIHELKYHEVQKEHCILLLNRIYVTIRKVLVKQHAQQLLDDLPKSVMFKDILLRCDRMVQVEEQIEAINKRLMEYASETSKSDSSKRATVRKVLRYMDQNYHKSLSLVEIAKIAHMAPSYFSMYFKKEMGENYITFANRMKIEKAKELLQDPSIKIYEVCSMVGFDDSKYFSRKFRAITGMTPKEYRDSIRVFIES